MILGKHSFGTGDGFGRQGKAQLAAIMKARQEGVEIAPVWNKSHREHSIIGTRPADTRREADEAVRSWARQLLHVGYRAAAEMGHSYLDALEKYEDIIARNVTENIYQRYIKPLFFWNVEVRRRKAEVRMRNSD